jgi:hypothetical protein
MRWMPRPSLRTALGMLALIGLGGVAALRLTRGASS